MVGLRINVRRTDFPPTLAGKKSSVDFDKAFFSLASAYVELLIHNYNFSADQQWWAFDQVLSLQFWSFVRTISCALFSSIRETADPSLSIQRRLLLCEVADRETVDAFDKFQQQYIHVCVCTPQSSNFLSVLTLSDVL